MAPRKKKTDIIDEKAEKLEELKKKAEKLQESIGAEEKTKNLAAKLAEEIAKEPAELESEEKKPKKKSKEVKLLTEKELKRVMTDTKETLVPLTDYIKCCVHLGTKVITPDMRRYVYKRRADGLAVINTNLIDDKLREGVAFLNQFEPGDLFIAGKREAAWPAIIKFSEVTGIRYFTKKYPAGIITNLILDNFFEVKGIIICDPWVDKNALNDAIKLKLPVLGICDTNNYAKGITHIIAGNNKSGKAVGLFLYILAREYLKSKGKEKEAKALKMEDFTGKLEEPVEQVQIEKAGYGV